MEIKVGDKVRVSKDAPRMYISIFTYICEEASCTVEAVKGGIATIKANDKIIAIPTKYLTKVDAEAKEPKFKVGDKVRVLGHALLEGGVFTITLVEHREKRGWMYRINTHTWYSESDLEPYTEPTEQTEAEKKPNIGSIKIPVEVDLTDSYWGAYAADLARDLTLKVANKYSDPKEAADYAVSVARAVVENLKKK